jgi:membrane protein YdbS with pleckstrin-like domain
MAVGIVTATVVILLYAPYSWGGWVFAAVLLGGAAALLVWPAPPIARWVSSHFVVTTDRVIRRSGLIAKEATEISLERITDVRTRQSVIERLVGAGDLTIESAGRLSPLTFEDVRHPDRVQKVIFERKEANAGRREARASGGGLAAGSIADELAKLHLLRAKGVISDREYDLLKARVIGRSGAYPPPPTTATMPPPSASHGPRPGRTFAPGP